jgi:PPOX class probable F420-dependent enzyme
MPEEPPLPDPSTPFGERVHRHLRDDPLVWLTTVAADGTPQPNPVWFLWEPQAAACLVYNFAGAARLRHVRTRPAVALHFDHAGQDTVVIAGRAEIPDAEPPADRAPAFLAKYGRLMASPKAWAARFPVPLRVHLIRTRGHLAAARQSETPHLA